MTRSCCLCERSAYHWISLRQVNNAYPLIFSIPTSILSFHASDSSGYWAARRGPRGRKSGGGSERDGRTNKTNAPSARRAGFVSNDPVRASEEPSPRAIAARLDSTRVTYGTIHELTTPIHRSSGTPEARIQLHFIYPC